MPADALVTLGARASAGTVLTPEPEYSVSSIKKSLVSKKHQQLTIIHTYII